MFNRAATAMDLLDPLALTGRSRSHVVELPQLGCALHRAAVDPFQALCTAAAADGLQIRAVSGFRDYARQRAIWNGKYSGARVLLDRGGQPLDAAALAPEQRVRAILDWSALPGASRHHWGTEIDVIDAAALAAQQPVRLLPAEFAAGGPFAALAHWLQQHASRFGFFRPYDRDRGGVQPEPWHVSYAPVSHPALQALTLPVLQAALAQAQQQPDTALLGYEALAPLLPQIHARHVQAVAHPGAALALP